MTKTLTAGPPARQIVLFTIPLLIGNVFQQLYSFTDAAVVGRLIDVNALASVGATGGLVFLLVGFTWGSSGGLAIPVARAFGAGDMPAMRRYVAAGVYVTAGIAAFITIVGGLFSRRLLVLLATPPELIDGATTFLAITFGGAAVTAAFNLLAGMIRALGDSRTPLIFLVLSCVLNVGLALLFVGVWHIGIAGSALATIVAQCVSVLACLVLIAKKMPQLRPRGADWHLQPGELAESMRSGLAMGFQMSIIAVGSLVLQFAINGLGSLTVAAFTSAMRVDQLANAPLNSFGLAMATYVAQNRGACEWRRIRVGVLRILFVVVGLACLLGAVNIFFGTNIVRIFVGEGEEAVVALAHQYLIVQGVTYVLLALLFLLRNTIQGLGFAGVPTMAGFMEFAVRTTAALVLVHMLGFYGVCLAAPLAWVGALIPCTAAWIRQRHALIVAEHKLDERRDAEAGNTVTSRREPALAVC